MRNPARYLLEKASGRHGLNGNAPVVGAIHNPWTELRDAFDAAGWVGLSNTRGRLKLEDIEIALTGLDDPHIKRDRYAEVTGGPEAGADLSLAVVHAPYLRVLDAFTADRYPLILAGHTHGGQLCIPFYGALVTNCDLDTRRVKGLSSTRPAATPPTSTSPRAAAPTATPRSASPAPGSHPAHPHPPDPLTPPPPAGTARNAPTCETSETGFRLWPQVR
ncbi:hypothetical protein SANTM175S_10912 [Streptomyces antimycoticus]